MHMTEEELYHYSKRQSQAHIWVYTHHTDPISQLYDRARLSGLSRNDTYTLMSAKLILTEPYPLQWKPLQVPEHKRQGLESGLRGPFSTSPQPEGEPCQRGRERSPTTSFSILLIATIPVSESRDFRRSAARRSPEFDGRREARFRKPKVNPLLPFWQDTIPIRELESKFCRRIPSPQRAAGK